MTDGLKLIENSYFLFKNSKSIAKIKGQGKGKTP